MIITHGSLFLLHPTWKSFQHHWDSNQQLSDLRLEASNHYLGECIFKQGITIKRFKMANLLEIFSLKSFSFQAWGQLLSKWVKMRFQKKTEFQPKWKFWVKIFNFFDGLAPVSDSPTDWRTLTGSRPRVIANKFSRNWISWKSGQEDKLLLKLNQAKIKIYAWKVSKA